jgi:hypothetical protein
MKNQNEIEVPLLVHRAVAQAFVENPNNYLYVLHKDGNLENNHAVNLEWMAEGGDQELFDHPRYQGITDPHELTMAYVDKA